MFARMNLGQLGIFGRLSLIVAALAIPFTALCVWMILQLAQFARDDQRASLIYAARSISAAVDAQLGIIDTLGQVLSNSPALLNDDLPAFEQEVRRTIAPGSDSWAMVADLQGQQLLNTALPAGQPLPVRSARGLVAQRKAFATHHSIVSEVLKGTATNVWIATIDVPIFKDGKPFRELVVSMDVKFFAGLLNAQNLPNGWRAARRAANPSCRRRAGSGPCCSTPGSSCASARIGCAAPARQLASGFTIWNLRAVVPGGRCISPGCWVCAMTMPPAASIGYGPSCTPMNVRRPANALAK